MNGWGNVFLTIAPDGTALPCHTARMLPGITFPNVTSQTVQHAWYESDAFNRFRGTGWMKAPCASCPEKENDLGGCRCQAMMLAGDPAAADPVCDKSDHHQVVKSAVDAAQSQDRTITPTKPLIFRDPKNSLALSGGSDRNT
jgi:pyrroloquinoline quinone biosynthesis protein E